MRTRVYTDGSCLSNCAGGWAYCICERNKYEIKSGGVNNTTPNKMELKAVYNALVKCIAKGIKQVDIYTDSSYIINMINYGWMEELKKNDWKFNNASSSGNVRYASNKEQWILIENILSSGKIDARFMKVKAHSGNTFNELVDDMARMEARKLCMM